MKSPVFTGSSVAIVTPFSASGPDYEVLGRLLDLQLAAGTAAITVCGTTGEASAMTAKERRDTIAFCVQRVAGRVPVIAGTGCNDTQRALNYSLDALQVGADALLVVTPYYNKTTQRGLVAHYTYLADRIPLPLIVYNVPSRTGMTVSAETYVELSRHPNINGVKEASGSIGLVSAILDQCGDSLHVWSGNDGDTVPLMALGAKGVISVAANVIPASMAEMTRACLSGDYAAAASIQLRYRALEEALFCEINPIPVKAALSLMGLDAGRPRLPLVSLSDENLQKLCQVLTGLGLI